MLVKAVAETPDAAKAQALYASRFPIGERGGAMPEGFHLNNSPAELLQGASGTLLLTNVNTSSPNRIGGSSWRIT